MEKTKLINLINNKIKEAQKENDSDPFNKGFNCGVLETLNELLYDIKSDKGRV